MLRSSPFCMRPSHAYFTWHNVADDAARRMLHTKHSTPHWILFIYERAVVDVPLHTYADCGTFEERSENLRIYVWQKGTHSKIQAASKFTHTPSAWHAAAFRLTKPPFSDMQSLSLSCVGCDANAMCARNGNIANAYCRRHMRLSDGRRRHRWEYHRIDCEFLRPSDIAGEIIVVHICDGCV